MTERRQRLLAYVLLAASVALALTGLRTVLGRLEDQNRAHAGQEQRAVEDRRDIKALLETAATAARNAEAAATDAKAALDLIEDCTTPAGECYRRGQQRTAEAVNEIVRRLNAASAVSATVLAQNRELQRQVDQLKAESAALLAYARQQADKPTPAPPPPTPVLCQLVRC